MLCLGESMSEALFSFHVVFPVFLLLAARVKARGWRIVARRGGKGAINNRTARCERRIWGGSRRHCKNTTHHGYCPPILHVSAPSPSRRQRIVKNFLYTPLECPFFPTFERILYPHSLFSSSFPPCLVKQIEENELDSSPLQQIFSQILHRLNRSCSKIAIGDAESCVSRALPCRTPSVAVSEVSTGPFFVLETRAPERF
ncbi:hypothetical protein V8C26DRAFT_397675 [Trichoderma gracile]